MSKRHPVAPDERATFLERRRARKMAASAHAYVRGSTGDFYAWLAELPRGTVPEGPPVWICGDCHLGNLGPLADADGRVDIQIRDLDQTVVGNPAHDLVRLGLSLASAARGSALPGLVTARMLGEMAAGYVAGLTRADGATPDEPEVVGTVRRRALGRRWKHLARERIADVRPSIPLGRRFWALSPEERAAIAALFTDGCLDALGLGAGGRAGVDLLDAAYWMKGCSSLGKLRYAALVGVGEGGRRRLALVDLKEAVESLAPAAAGAFAPVDPARRVVAGARALAPNLGTRMLPVRLLGRPVVMRELLPQDLKLDVDQFTGGEAVRVARYLAHVVGRAHGRQMDGPTRAAWAAALDRPEGADAPPTWLWSSVVALAGRHEVGYLEHCRTLEDLEPVGRAA